MGEDRGKEIAAGRFTGMWEGIWKSLVRTAENVRQLTSGLLRLGDDCGNLGYTPVDFRVLLLLSPSRFDADAIQEADGLRLLIALSRDFGVRCLLRL